MPWRVPNDSERTYAEQAVLDRADLSVLVAGIAGDGVVTGCEVSAQVTPNMTLAVAAGAAHIGGARITVAGGNVTVSAANATNPRLDLVQVDNAGVKSVKAGLAAPKPVLPDPDANNIVLAEVNVPATVTAITTAMLNSRVVNVARIGARANSAGATYARRRLNFIPGTNVTLSIADDSVNEEVGVTISATAGGGGGIDYAQSADPGAVGAGKTWLNTTIGAYKRRNAANTLWLPILSGNVIDPRWFGAIAYGDETTAAAGIDNGPAINAAIVQAATSVGTGGGPALVELPPGCMGFATQLVLYRGVVLVGRGTDRDRGGSCLVAQSGLAVDGLVAEPFVVTSDWMHQCGLRDVAFRFSRQTAGAGLKLSKLGENFTMDRVQVQDSYGPGIWIDNNSTPFNLGFLTVHGCGRGGVATAGQNAAVLIDNSASGNGHTGSVIQYISADNNYGAMLHTRYLNHESVFLAGFKVENTQTSRMPYVIINEDGKGGQIIIASGSIYTDANGTQGTSVLYSKRVTTTYPAALPGYFRVIGMIDGYDQPLGTPRYTNGYVCDDSQMPTITITNFLRRQLFQGITMVQQPTDSTVPALQVQGHIAFGTPESIGPRIYAGAGAPSFAGANGSVYLRSDGVGTTDNEYIRRSGAWVGIA